jgi:hypothetical protein
MYVTMYGGYERRGQPTGNTTIDGQDVLYGVVYRMDDEGVYYSVGVTEQAWVDIEWSGWTQARVEWYSSSNPYVNANHEWESLAEEYSRLS